MQINFRNKAPTTFSGTEDDKKIKIRKIKTCAILWLHPFLLLSSLLYCTMKKTALDILKFISKILHKIKKDFENGFV